jgi:hypothetical protein
MLYFAPAGADAPFEISVRSTVATPPALLLIKDTDSHFGVAADRAADRAGHAVARVIHSSRHWSTRRTRT